MEIVRFDTEDVIRTSPLDGDDSGVPEGNDED